MKVMIAGAGSVGMAIGEDLAAKGYDVIVMEREPGVAEKLAGKTSVELVVGDACEVTSLQNAGAGEVDVMVAATGDDEDNLVISLLAKQEFAVPRVVARVNNTKNHWLFNESWGVDVSVSTPQQLTALVEEAVSVGSLVRLLQFEHGNANLVEVTLASNSPGIGKSISEIGFPREASIVAIIREEHVVVPNPDSILLGGDEVVVLVTEDAEGQIRLLLCGDAS
jgi:trk system potassium uptake protein TrkA